ncbi:restriction endonuclease subunit S [Haemophilus haemolyticus]|uniref:restriction endonuclease subunit S n=1 Tax=Haemophilus haemolyticus TaxID=726 RepID=UPI003D809627
MSDWQTVTLEDVTESINTGLDAIRRAPIVEYETNLRCLRIQDISQNKPFDKWGYTEVKDSDFKKFQLVPNDIIMARTCSTGICYLVKKELPAVFNNGLARIRLKIEKVDPQFIYYVFKSKHFSGYIDGISGGTSVQLNMKIGDLLKYQFNLPPLSEQKEIARILSDLDKKIELNTQINQTLEQIAQALFKSWFVDFDPVRTKVQALSDGMSLEQAELAAMQAISGKTPEELTALSQIQPDYYAELAETAKAFPCEMVEVDGVEVPKGWEVKELGSLMTIKRGGSPRPIKDFISDKGLNWVKISDATAEDNPFLFSTKEYIKSEGLSKTVLLNKGSLILSNSATPGLPRFLELDACIHDGWLYFSDIKSLTQEYLYFFFLNIRNDLVAQGNGSVFTNLKTDIVKAQKAIVPDERVICYFDKQVKSIMNLIRYNTANSISLKETRDLLLPKLLNGGV